jgi:hypothetical protein
VDGKEIARKNVVAAENETVEDSLECTVYGSGRKSVQLGTLSSPLELLPDPPGKIQGAEVLALKVSPVCRVGEKSEIELLVVNKSSKTLTDTLEVTLDGSRFLEEIVTLESGVTRQINTFASLEKPGVHTITAGKISATIKIYAENRESSLLEISPGSLIPGDTIPDGSGFLNTGIVRNALKFDPDTGTSQPLADEYIEMRPSASLDRLKNKITVMTWVYPHKNRQLSDIISKGDHIVLQASAQTLTFFAGGWGRGVCESKLPDDWFGKWHHLAGVYDGNSLKLYIDGILSASETRLLPGNLLSFQRWMIMRNEEFPDIRHFKGKTDHLKIFAEPLNDDQIRAEMTENQPGN